MAGMTDTHVWMADVTDEVAALSTADAKALVLGSTFARRVKSSDREHGDRLCDHGRLLFQDCKFCATGVPALCDPTFAQQRETVGGWLP